MSRSKLAVVVVLGALGSFLVTFVISIALAMGDEDAVTSTELTLSPPLADVAADEARTATAAPSPSGPSGPRPNVDPDCYGDGLVCKKERLADVEALANLVEPIAAAEGWPSGCFEIRILGGDDGELDAVSVSVDGRPNLGAARCRQPDKGGATKGQVARLGAKLKAGLKSSSSAHDVDLLQVTDGTDIDVQIPLR